MKMKPIEEPEVCPACNAQSTGPRLRDCPYRPSDKRRGFGMDETKQTGEQVTVFAELGRGAARGRGRQGRVPFMVRQAESVGGEIPVDGTVSLEAKRPPAVDPHQAARRLAIRPCPSCGSRTVRSRDGRDLCLICGYLQAHA